MTTSLQVRCAAFAAWTTAALRDEVGVEQALDAIHAAYVHPVIANLRGGQTTDIWDAYALTIGRWRTSNVTGWRYLPLAPGDMAGLPGPATFKSMAVDAGVALVSVGNDELGLAPYPVTSWTEASEGHQGLAQVVTTDRFPISSDSLTEVDAMLLRALTDAVTTLENLDLAAWHDAIPDLLRTWDDDVHMPPHVPPRARLLAARSQRVLELVDLASTDQGASRTANEMAVRASTLRDLGRTARAAHAAAWNTGLIAAADRR